MMVKDRQYMHFVLGFINMKTRRSASLPVNYAYIMGAYAYGGPKAWNANSMPMQR